MELTEVGERPISIFGVEVFTTIVVEEFGVENLKEYDVVEGDKVERESRCAESIFSILVADI